MGAAEHEHTCASCPLATLLTFCWGRVRLTWPTYLSYHAKRTKPTAPLCKLCLSSRYVRGVRGSDHDLRPLVLQVKEAAVEKEGDLEGEGEGHNTEETPDVTVGRAASSPCVCLRLLRAWVG